MRLLFYLFALLIPLSITANQKEQYPAGIETILKKAGSNRLELEKAIRYFKTLKDPQKLKAIYFLIANMDIHHSAEYYWMDEKGKKINFNELAYPSYAASILAFNKIKQKHVSVSAKKAIRPDIQYIRASFLINNVEQAFKVWRSSLFKRIPFNSFCEYILPYRVTDEPLQDWRLDFVKKFQWISNQLKSKSFNDVLTYVALDRRSWFTDTWGSTNRTDPLPRLGPLQLLFRKEGQCEDIANLEVFTLRSQGIASSLNIVPYWATSSDSHFVNTAFDATMNAIKFDVTRTPAVNAQLAREPSKVLRITYSKQPGVIAEFEKGENIPDGFMRKRNYIDITNQYWQTADVQSTLFPNIHGLKVAYICVFNKMNWRPTWWGKINQNAVTFTSMSKGTVFLPVYYFKGKVEPAAYPIAMGYNNQAILNPDIVNRRTIVLQQEQNRLIFQAGKSYSLYFWDNKWKLCATKQLIAGSKALTFPNVPKNALLILRPEYSEGKERPFLVTDGGTRVWF